MQLEHLKSTVKRSVILCVGISGLFLGIVTVSQLQKASSQENLDRLKQEARRLSADIKRSEREITNLRDAIESYQDIDEFRFPSEQGLNNSAARIRSARRVFDPLKERYKLNTLDVSFEEIKSHEATQKNNEFYLAENKLLVKFSTSTDEIVYSLIRDMVMSFDGYLQLDKLILQKDPNVWEELVRASQSSDGELVKPFDFVNGSAEFSWKTVEGGVIDTSTFKQLNIEGLVE